MSIMIMSEIFQLSNDSKQQTLVKATTFPTVHPKSELELVNDRNVKQDRPGQTNYHDTLLCRDALGSERFSRSPSSLQLLTDIKHKDSEEELGETIQEDYCSPYLDEKKIISYRVNKEARDEIDQLTDIFRSCVMKTIYREISEVSHAGNPRVAKGLKLKITMSVVHQQYSSMSSNSSSHRPSFEGITMTVVQQSSFSSNSSGHRLSCEGRKSFILEATNCTFESGKADSSKEIENPQNYLRQSKRKLPLPPRLREASYRNPLRLGHIRRCSTDLAPPSSLEELFRPKESPRRNNVQSPLSKIVKRQKEISVKLWRRSLDLIRQYGKLQHVFPQFSRHACWSPAVHGDRLQWNGDILYNLNGGQSG